MLEVSNIEVVYNGVIRAVQNVSLNVPDKSVVALLGANGAGKTSVLRAISGLLGMQRGKLVSGTITLDGRTYRQVGRRRRLSSVVWPRCWKAAAFSAR